MPNTTAGSIRLFVLGDARIETPVAVIEPSAELAFATALRFLLESDVATSRRAIQDLLWPGIPMSKASHRLRQTLHKLRGLGVPIGQLGKHRLTLNNVTVWVDCEDAVAKQEVITSNQVARFVLLPGYEPSFSSPYLEWLDKQKAVLTASLTRMVLGTIAKQRMQGLWGNVETSATALLRVSPFNEEATLALAEAYAMRGSKIEAERILDEYLAEVGTGPADMRIPATIMRRRIIDRSEPRPRIAWESPLVGRAHIMMRLGEMLAKVRHGKGQACLAWGAAGIGKSRLMSEFSLFSSLQGVSTQRVQCRSSDPRRPLSIFVNLVPLLQTMRGAIGCSPETIAYLQRLTRQRSGDGSSHSGDGDAQFVYARVEKAVFDLIEAVSEEKPLLIVFEDIHWIDDISKALLANLVDWCKDHRVMFAVTSRSRPDWWLSHSEDTSDFALPPLEADAATQLIQGIVRQHGKDIDFKHLNWCVTVAEGNPFFLEELTNQWLETGEIRDAPASVTAVIEQRISRLNKDALQVLQTCALLENHATFERIETSLGYQPYRLLQSTNDLAAAGMLTSRTPDDDGGSFVLVPRHDLIALACLSRLAEQARVFLHRRVASVLEADVVNSASTALLWDCAKHWQLAGDSSRAFSLARACGLHLMEVGLPLSAAEAFDKALTYCSKVSDTLSILAEQTRAYEQSSSWISVKKIENVAREIINKLEPANGNHDELELRAIRAQWKTGDCEDALGRALQCLNCTDATQNHRVKAGALALMVQDALGRHEEMPIVHHVIEELAINQTVSNAAILEARLVFHTVRGSFATAIETAETLVTLQRQNDQGDLFRHLCNASVTYRVAGRFAQAHECLKEAVTIAESHRLPGPLARSLAMLAHLNLEQGHWSDAELFYVQLLQQSGSHDEINTTLDIASLGTRLSLIRGDVVGAAACNTRPFSEILQDPVGQRRTYAIALFCSIELASGRAIHPEVIAGFQTAYHISKRGIAQAFNAYVLYALLVKSGNVKKAAKLLDDYRRNYRREAWPADTLFRQVMQSLSPGTREASARQISE